MALAGYDVSLGDMWALNEVPAAVRQGTGQARRNLLDFLHGLYGGTTRRPRRRASCSSPASASAPRTSPSTSRT